MAHNQDTTVLDRSRDRCIEAGCGASIPAGEIYCDVHE